MEVGTYVALGTDVIAIVAIVVLVLALRTGSESRDDAVAQLVASVRSDAQHGLDAATLATEAATLKHALQAQTARADALQEFIAHDARTTDPGAGLAPDDVAGRVLRLSQRWAASVPAVGDGSGPGTPAPVRDAGAAPATGAHDVPGH